MGFFELNIIFNFYFEVPETGQLMALSAHVPLAQSTRHVPGGRISPSGQRTGQRLEFATVLPSIWQTKPPVLVVVTQLQRFIGSGLFESFLVPGGHPSHEQVPLD